MPSVTQTGGHLIEHEQVNGEGPKFCSTDPANGHITWTGRAATGAEVDRAVQAARSAFADWADTRLEKRIEHLRAFAAQLTAHHDELSVAICTETGKPRWESRSEVDTMVAKIALSIESHARRHATESIDLPAPAGLPRSAGTREAAGGGFTRFKPHGTLAVLGPFNLPGHLPNGHIVPALLAGNTVVFKPSEQAPGVGQKMVELWIKAGIPPGVVNLVQGGRETGEALAAHEDIDGLLFTGSVAAGRALGRALAEHPQKILVLEMGGNNPMIVHRVSDLDAAAYLAILSAFMTAGQRCTCARRLIVPAGDHADRFVDRLAALTCGLGVGPWDEQPQPFMGPLISTDAAATLLHAQQDLIERGGRTIVPLTADERRPAMLRPGIIDVSPVADRPDEELFGPLLQLIRTPDFDAALDEANHTAFGLSAALFSDEANLYEQFYRRIRAGVVNWNRPTTGASGRLPFGGVGCSGNHRPSGYYAADYCAFPVASLEAPRVALPEEPLPGITL